MSSLAIPAPSVFPASSALRRRGEEETKLSTNLADGFSWWCSEAIGFYTESSHDPHSNRVTGLVFTGIGAGIGYVLGYIEAENFYKIRHGEKP